jgi:hypothetical protein
MKIYVFVRYIYFYIYKRRVRVARDGDNNYVTHVKHKRMTWALIFGQKMIPSTLLVPIKILSWICSCWLCANTF